MACRCGDFVSGAVVDDPRLDHFVAKLDRMVNDDAIDNPREVRAALDEAQATIRRLLSAGDASSAAQFQHAGLSGKVSGLTREPTAGELGLCGPAEQDKRTELHGLIHDVLQTVAEAATELRQSSPDDLGVDELDRARRKLIRARAIAARGVRPDGTEPHRTTAPGMTVDGDILRDLILDATPRLISDDAATRIAEDTLDAAARAGMTVLHGPNGDARQVEPRSLRKADVAFLAGLWARDGLHEVAGRRSVRAVWPDLGVALDDLLDEQDGGDQS